MPPSNLALVRAFDMMKSRLDRMELLPVYENGTFARADASIENLLGILAVHPMREAAVRSYLEETGINAGTLETLVRDGRVGRVEHLGDTFYVRVR